MKVKILIVIALTVVFSFPQNLWVETTQEDFADGIYECNLYASLKDGGTIEFTPKWDLNNDSYLDLIISNSFGNFSYVYWGSASGYSPSNRTDYPILAGDCEAVDLDYDGYPELVFTAGNLIRIFRGTPSGPNPGDYTDVSLYELGEACFIADYNKDGYLDLAVGRYDSNNGGVFWGDSTGFSPSNMTLLPANAQHNMESGDFDNNGWLDIIFVQDVSNVSYVYWGSDSGFDPVNMTQLTNPTGGHTHGCSVADLNSDRYLDVVLTGFYGCNQLYIYTGSQNGFTLWQTLLPGECYGGTSIADFDHDGYLDILATRGYGIYYKPIIYWGSSTGYSESNKIEIGIAVDVSGSFVADCNYDGELDIFINNYDPGSQSYLFDGPNFTTYISLPNDRDHHSRFREVGNVYNREYYDDYISSVYDAGEIVNWGIVEWDDSLPPETDILFYVRSGNTPNPDTSWSGWDSLGNGDEIADSLNSQYLQYRARMTYTNPSYLPYLYEVRIAHSEAGAIFIFPDQTNSGLPGNWVNFPLTCRNDQNFVDTIDLVLQDQLGWSYNLLDSLGNPLVDNNNNGMVDIPGIGASGGEADFNTEILIPSSTPSGTVDSILLFGYSGKDSTVQDSALLILTVDAYAQILIEPNCADSGNYEDSIDYRLFAQNLGNEPDIIDLMVIGGNFDYSLRDIYGNLLTDTNNNGLVDLGVILPFTGESLMVRVKITSSQAGFIDTVLIRAISSNNPSIYDDAGIRTKVLGGIWGLILDPDQEARLEPGQAISFPVDVFLQGSIADIVELEIEPVPPDWVVGLTDSTALPLNDTDNDGYIDLGMVVPQVNHRFYVSVIAPGQFDLIGEVDTLASCNFHVKGWCSSREDITDSVYLRVRLVPPFDVHNFRNPFRSQTQFIFGLPKDGRVTLQIYNRVGELVRRLISNQSYNFGVHYYPWDGENDAGERLAPGTYIYVLDFRANDGEQRTAKKKAVILK